MLSNIWILQQLQVLINFESVVYLSLSFAKSRVILTRATTISLLFCAKFKNERQLSHEYKREYSQSIKGNRSVVKYLTIQNGVALIECCSG